MDLRLDDTSLQEALNEGLQKTMARVFESHEVTQALGDLVTKDVLVGVLSTAVKEASERIDIEPLVFVLAREMAEGVARGVKSVIRESVVGMVFRMRHGDGYRVDEKVTREAIRMELFPEE